MRRFTRLYLDLDATNSTLEKTSLLRGYFEHAPDADAAWALALFVGERPKGAASSRALKSLALEVTGVPGWLFAECRQAAGDLSETIALLLPEHEPAGSDELSLTGVMEQHVLPLAGASEAERAEIIRAAWDALGADERFVYHKLVRGGFRVGVQKRLVTRALAEVAGVDPKTVAQRLTGGFTPAPESYRAVLSGEESSERALAPLPFFLAPQLEKDPVELGDPADWRAEWKYDGIRAQLVRRGGEAALWSRGDELVTAQFPEIAAAAKTLPTDAVLDGEVLVWSGARPRPFAELQRRLNRTAAPPPQLHLFDDTRVVMIVFDLLERAGEDLRDRPHDERRAALEELLQEAGALRLAPRVEIASWEELAGERETSRARGVEGLMLKHKDSDYGEGRRRSDTGWWKWKVDPFSVDAVLVSAQPGSGRRASLYTDYTFALWSDGDGEGNGRALVTFAKAYSGLDQDEIETLDKWIRANTTKKAGPFRTVEPLHVFEIAFEGAQRSTRHKSGVAVRFPRIARWRRDKPAEEADDVAAVRAIAEGRVT